MNSIIQNLSYSQCEDNSVWAGVIHIEKEKYEIHIEAPKDGFGRKQIRTAESLPNMIPDLKRKIFRLTKDGLIENGINENKILEEKFLFDIICIPKETKENDLVLVGTQKMKGVFGKKMLFEAVKTNDELSVKIYWD